MADAPPLRVLELFSGVGGMHYAHTAAVGPERTHVVAAFDIYDVANRVYRANFPETTVYQRNIEALPVAFFERLEPDVMLMSPPCQPYTRMGLKLGPLDARARSFLHVLTVLDGLEHKPSYILLENVRGFEFAGRIGVPGIPQSSDSRDQIVATLRRNGYAVREFLISPTQMNVPNSRLRYYLLAKRHPLRFDDGNGEPGETVMQVIPGSDRVAPVDPDAPPLPLSVDAEDSDDVGDEDVPTGQRVAGAPEDAAADGAGTAGDAKRPRHAAAARTPPVAAATATIAAYLDRSLSGAALEALAVPNGVLWKAGAVCDIVQPTSRQSCCFTKAYSHHVEGAGSFLQQDLEASAADAGRLYRLRLAAGDGPSSGPCPLADLRLRYFSDVEVAALLGFPPSFRMPADVPRKQRYRLLGNSLSITVVAELLRFLYREPPAETLAGGSPSVPGT